MNGKAELVDQIKSMQRTDPGFKQAWWEYCDQFLGGSKDPNRHEQDVLEEFLANYSGDYAAPQAPARTAPVRAQRAPPARPTGVRPAARLPVGRAPIPPAAMAMASVGLADVVKTGQRLSPSWKTAWQSYCGLYGNSVNDPSRHDDAFTRGFIDYVGELAEQALADIAAEAKIREPVVGSKRSSSWGEPPAKRQATPALMAPEKQALVDKVKALQRSNPDAKQAWWDFCDQEAKGVKDPSRH
eukprot:CAMPEP_0197646984 /NCGR_PEP_ID=MMETSP1338-20131121/23968_1 /TAXON_ID=43686 ORGANISM="Pelagodinium beii, Strain RCC1491" /NCGR_SAMPLE_ID=MMETSP1338 /ASSEMBLY_ACC=CAM_ASM_000754 /LENGTH=241 /DNA_ID=CAMNT_0043220677 /DNA_START=63 /DNA_END=785 /DNA_ORIENTATION=+